MAPKSFVFITGNANKLREVQYILAQGSDLEITSTDLDVPEIQGSIEEVASAKCRAAAEKVGGPCFTEDTALCFKALNGLPGPYIKYFMQAVGHSGLNNMLAGFDTKEATAVCTFAYSAGPGHEPIIFDGRVEGTLVLPRGSPKFGWDAAFEPLLSESGLDTLLTYGEMDEATKSKFSHRSKALAKLKAYLLELP